MNNWRRKRRIYFFIIFIFLIAIGWLIYTRLLTFSYKSLAEMETCPACFGVTMCPALLGGQIEIDTSLTNLMKVKNVLYGKYKGKQIVLKKLGHDWELEELNNRICTSISEKKGCELNDIHWKASNIHQRIADLTEFNSSLRQTQSGSSMTFCPLHVDVQKLFEKVVRKNRGTSPGVVYTNIWTMVQINPEPLILQVSM